MQHTVNQITKSNFSPSLSDRIIREMFHPFQYSVCSIAVVWFQALCKLKTSMHLTVWTERHETSNANFARSFISSGQWHWLNAVRRVNRNKAPFCPEICISFYKTWGFWFQRKNIIAPSFVKWKAPSFVFSFSNLGAAPTDVKLKYKTL